MVANSSSTRSRRSRPHRTSSTENPLADASSIMSDRVTPSSIPASRAGVKKSLADSPEEIPGRAFGNEPIGGKHQRVVDAGVFGFEVGKQAINSAQTLELCGDGRGRRPADAGGYAGSSRGPRARANRPVSGAIVAIIVEGPAPRRLSPRPPGPRVMVIRSEPSVTLFLEPTRWRSSAIRREAALPAEEARRCWTAGRRCCSSRKNRPSCRRPVSNTPSPSRKPRSSMEMRACSRGTHSPFRYAITVSPRFDRRVPASAVFQSRHVP